MSDPVRIEGLDEAFARLDATQIERVSSTLLQRLVLIVEKHAKTRTPVRTGTLRRSITSTVQGANRGIVGTNVAYARFVHDGTGRMAARPFLKRGLEDSRTAIDREVEAAGRRMIEGAA